MPAGQSGFQFTLNAVNGSDAAAAVFQGVGASAPTKTTARQRLSFRGAVSASRLSHFSVAGVLTFICFQILST